MRYLIVLFFGLVLNANSIDRAEYIVDDIDNLKKDYRQCIDLLNIANLQNGCSESRTLKKLKQENKKHKLLLKKKKQELALLQKKYNQLVKNSKKPTLPTLVDKSSCVNILNKNIKEGEIYEFKSSAFRLIAEANLFDKPNGNIIDTWENKTSFTSGIRTKKWIKITGYFVDKVWQKAIVEMWIKSDKAIKR